jgi:hypothetical protein
VSHLFEQAPDALFLPDPERETISDADRPACRLLAYLVPYRLTQSVRIRDLDSGRSRVWSFMAESRRLSDLARVTYTCQVVLVTVSASPVDIEERA